MKDDELRIAVAEILDTPHIGWSGTKEDAAALVERIIETVRISDSRKPLPSNPGAVWRVAIQSASLAIESLARRSQTNTRDRDTVLQEAAAQEAYDAAITAVRRLSDGGRAEFPSDEMVAVAADAIGAVWDCEEEDDERLLVYAQAALVAALTHEPAP